MGGAGWERLRTRKGWSHVGSRESAGWSLYVRSLAPVFVAECCFQGLLYDMLSYAASSSRDSGPPQKCSRPSYAHNTQACRYLVGRSAPLSKHSRLLLYTFKMFYHGNDARHKVLCGARSSSALNMLVTPYTRELRDFNEPSGDPRGALATLGTLQKRTTSGH